MLDQKALKNLKKASKESTNKNYLKAISFCKKVISQAPNSPQAYKLLATNLISMNRFDEAENVLEKTLILVEGDEADQLLHLLGCNYSAKEDYIKSLSVLEELFNRTGNTKVLLDIALALAEIGHYRDARDVYLKLIEFEPENHQAKFNLYSILLRFGEYQSAWTCFHSRLYISELKDKIEWFAPQWSGEPLKGKNILICPEQGIGDNLLYSCCFSEAIRDAKTTYIACDTRLMGLFQHNFPTATIVPVNEPYFVEQLDVQILSGSLSYLYRTSLESFKEKKRLHLPAPLIAEKNSRLSKKKLKIGISWFHGRVNDGNKNSMTLEELLPLLKIEDVEWVNLQFGDWKKEAANLQNKHNIKITHFEDCSAASNFDHYGALISNLDLVIAASNAAFTYAARLGIKSWMFLPTVYAPSETENHDSLWFEDERHFHKNHDKDWSGVVSKLCDEVKLLLNSQ